MTMTHRKIMIGSGAIRHHFPDFPREVETLDFIGIGQSTNNLHFYWANSFKWIVNHVWEDIAPPDILYTIKASRCFWPGHEPWSKTMKDIAFFQRHNVKLNQELFQMLYKEWEDKYGAPLRPTCMYSSTHFKLHDIVAYYAKPLYFQARLGASLKISKAVFNKMPHELQIKMCREEIHVTAIEKFHMNNIVSINCDLAYSNALKLLITNLQGGWFKQFLVENWLELETPDGFPYLELYKSNREGHKTIPLSSDIEEDLCLGV